MAKVFITDEAGVDTVPVDNTAGLKVDLGADNDVTLGANDGVDIGDVDVTSVIPLTGATNLGKAIDSPVGSTDTGVLLLAVHDAEASKISVAEEDYDHLHIGELGGLSVEPEQHNHLDEMDVTTGWTVLGDDTANLLTTTNHLTGTAALIFDKVNGDANTVFAGIQKTITTLNMGELDLHDTIQTACYISSLSQVNYVFVRIGTSSSNYNEWRVQDTELTADEWLILGLPIGQADFAGNTANGVDWAAISYIAVGVAFDGETNTLTGIRFDQLGIFTGSHTTANFTSEVSSDVSSPNVNVKKWGSQNVTLNTGVVTTGTLRVTLATDDTVTVDNGGTFATQATLQASSNNVGDVDLELAGTAVSGNNGTADAGTIRVTVASDTTGVLSVDDNAGSLTVDNAGLTELAAAINASNQMDVNIAASAATVTVDLGANNDVTVTSTDSDGLEVQGGLDHDAIDAGSPLKMGGRAQDQDAQPDEVANDDRVDALFDRNGYQRVRGDMTPSFADINDSNSGDNEIIAAQAAGKKIAVWSVLVVSDGTTDVRFEDGADGTKFTGQVPLQAREGYAHSAGGLVPLWVGGAATNLNLELTAAVAVHGSVAYTVVDD